MLLRLMRWTRQRGLRLMRPDAAGAGCPAFWLHAARASEAAMMLKIKECFFMGIAFFGWIERARL